MPEWDLRLHGELAWARRDADGRIEHLALCRGRWLEAAGERLKATADSAMAEWDRS